jgi:acyl carrier protein
MITVEEARKRANESLAGYPPAVAAAYVDFVAQGDAKYLDDAILGILQFSLAKPPAQALSAMPGSTRLMEDLGVDSLAMMDTVFMIEGLLDLKIADEQLAALKSTDDLRQLIRRSLPADAAVES